MENEIVEAKLILDYLRDGRHYDIYYGEKLAAKQRALNFYVNRIQCDELRSIIKMKAQQYMS